MSMNSGTNPLPETSANSARLDALLDKLVAIQLDLEPICRVPEAGTPVVPASEAIAGACEILRSAIADLRRIIQQVDDRPAR